MKLEFLEAGEVVSTHGVRGEMKVLPWADGPHFLTDFKRIRMDGKDYTVEACRIQKTCNLLKVKGIDTMEAAQAMRGKVVEIYRCDAPADLIFAAELSGMRVENNGEYIGNIEDVLDYPGNKVYVVQGTHRYMIPAVKAFVLSTDLNENLMRVSLIEGMQIDES